METIHFFKEGIKFRLNQQDKLKKWILSVAKYHDYQLEEINFIFCSDQYLLKLNKKFLGHHYYTDVITFNHSDKKECISADVFISFDRVRENARRFKNTVKDEMHRVMIHGVLHLVGFNDKTEKEIILMKRKEDEWLTKRNF